jgi:hypothetical protein
MHLFSIWLLHPLGVCVGPAVDACRGYNFWSGIGSDFSEITLLAGVYMIWRKHNCHEVKCLRIGKHTVDGTPYCNKHHKEARK